MNNAELLPSKEAAEELGISRSTLNRWVEQHVITPSAKAPGLRGAFLFAPAEVKRVKALRSSDAD